MHLSKESHKHRSFSRTGGTNDEVDRAFLELDFVVDTETEGLSRRRHRPVLLLARPGEVRLAKPEVAAVLPG